MEQAFTKAILDREEHFPKKGDKPSYYKTQGFLGKNQFWDGPKCYIPILYKGQPKKLLQLVMNEHEYAEWQKLQGNESGRNQ